MSSKPQTDFYAKRLDTSYKVFIHCHGGLKIRIFLSQPKRLP